MARKQPTRKPGYRPKVAGAARNTRDTQWQSRAADADIAAPVDDPDAATVESVAGEPATAGTESVETNSGVTEPATAKAESVETGPATVEAEAETAEAETAEVSEAGGSETEELATAASDTVVLDKERPTGKPRPVSRVSTLRPSADATKNDAVKTDATENNGARGIRDKRSHRVRNAASAGRWYRLLDRSWFTTRTIGVLVAAAVVLGIVAAVAAVHPGASLGPNKAFLASGETTEVASQVGSKICTAISFDGPNVDAWAKRARAVLADKALKNFNDYLPTQRQLIQQTGAVADCRAYSVGVNDLNTKNHTARLVVSLIVSQSVNGVAVRGAAPGLQVDAKRVGDQWLITSIEVLNPEA